MLRMYSSHRDWYAEHGENVSEVGETKRYAGPLIIPAGCRADASLISFSPSLPPKK